MSSSDDSFGSRRSRIPEALHFAAFICVFLNIILSPWCFGAWEMWWFWPMAALLFAGCLLSGAAALCGDTFSASSGDDPREGHFILNGRLVALVVCALPFLAYAVIRARFPSAPGRPLVEMEAERSLLLFFTPVAVAAILFLSFTRRRVRFLLWAFLLNAVLIAIYGTVNQYLTYGPDKPDYVMWVLTPWGYGDRVKGPFFCPNHLSAYLNLAICLCMGLLFAPKTTRMIKAIALIACIPLAVADFLTLSRGGIASILIGLLIALPTIAMRGHRLLARLLAPGVVIVLALTAFLVITKTDNPLMTRVKTHPLYITAAKNVGSPEWCAKMHDAFWYSFDRGTYIQSALRAWRSNPVWGIGPGQHSNRWAEFAATDDGVRPVDGDLSTLKKPRLRNSDYHLYEVHSDWTQLLEEYGIVGLSLFLISMLAVLVITHLSQSSANEYALTKAACPGTSQSNGDSDAVRRRSEHHRHHNTLDDDSIDEEDLSPLDRALPLASLMICLVMIIHSLGDFSFQMPAITWAFAVMIVGGILATFKTHHA